MIPARRTATAATVVLATAGGLLTTAATPASAAGCTSPTYTRQFFANTTFSGTPKRTDCDAGVDEYWSGSPATGVPTDNFSVRWTVTRDFGSGGPFSLTVRGQDGMRVYLDGYRKIDLWKGTNTTVSKTVNLTLPAGKHTLRVDYANWSGTAAVKFGYTPITSATYDKVKPLAPTGLAVGYDKVANKAQVTWARNKEMDLAGYRVYRRQAGTGTWVRMTTTTGTSYTDTSLPQTGSAYYYEVRAYDRAGNESYGTADVPVTTVDRTRPGTPVVTYFDYWTGELTQWTSTLKWAANKDTDLAGYRVYRRVEGSTTWTRVAATTALQYDDKTPMTGQTYYYQVRAYDKNGNESWGSTEQGPVPTEDYTPPAAPKLTATGVTDSNNLSWTASADAVKYRVFRRESGGTTFTLLAEVTGTGYTDTSAAYYKAYDYKVSALDALGNASESAVVSSTRSITPPQHVTASTTATDVVLSWSEPAGGDTADYVVRRSAASADGSRTWETITCGNRTTTADAAGNTVYSCTDASGRHGSTYHYTVQRRDTSSRLSLPSQEVTATRPGDETPPPALTGLTAQALEYGVRLGWQPSTASDLAYYEIYMQEEGLSEPQYVTQVDASKTQVTFVQPAEGAQRTYFVVATDRYGNSLTYKDEPDVDDWSVPVASVPVTQLDLRPTSTPPLNSGCRTSAWNAADGVTLEPWCPVTDTTGVAGFHAYRWDRTTSAWVRLTDAVVPKTRDGWRWTDTTAPRGTTVYYMLSIVAADGTETFTDPDYSVSAPTGS
ncbi:PA14 domain-containing protein [Streptomyces griseosporeus]|uniref:PA14 domain-containing protein n=1 Tax=Streptomyces griseosporeus TaxID=1910 RepID=UPI003702B488